MAETSGLAARVAELEQQLENLSEQHADALADGAMLKTLLEDISRRRKVEHRLEQAQEWLRLAQEAGRVAAYSFDFAGELLEWSGSTLALYGFPPDQEPTIESWLAAIHPDDRVAASQVAERALQQGFDVDHRFRIVRPDGAILWVQDRGRILLGDNGQPQRLVGINIDVTELVELERRASENEERLRLALQADRQSCWDWDVASGCVTWDEGLARYAGLESDFGGSFDAFWALVHEGDKQRLRAALDAALAGKSDYAIEFRMVRPDGGVRWTSTRAIVVRDELGRPLRMVGIDGDITERKRTEASLQEKEWFLESVLDPSTDCIKVVEPNGALTYMNRNGQRAMEIADFDQVVGRYWDELWPPESTELIRGAMERANSGETSRFEAFCPTAAGTPKWWEVSVAPIRSDDGRVNRIVSVSRDITERRESDERLRLLNAELHHRVKNNMAMVQAIARSSLRSAASTESFEQSFTARLGALAKTYTLLQADSDSASVGELVRTELEPFGRAAHLISLEGPDVPLPAAAAVSFGMIVHELATNAAKYGSLSRTDGALTVTWQVAGEDSRSLLALVWTETGGPEVGTPLATGFGSKLIQRLVAQLRGKLERSWTSTGLIVKLTVPLH